MAEGLRIGIAGAGLAGMSLAIALLKQPGFRGRVTVFEPRQAPVHDRHWSYWSGEAHAFDGLPHVDHGAIEVGTADRRVRVDLGRLRYRTLASGDVHAHAVATLDADARAELHWGRGLVSVTADDTSGLRLQLDDGEDAVVDLLFDSRPPPPSAAGFQQGFVGGVLRVERAPSTAVLMDFLDAGERIAFRYAIPLATDRVLMQLTWLLRPGEAMPADAEAQLAQQVQASFGASATWCGREEAVLPMRAFPRGRRAPGWWPIGTAAGWTRAATGYAFLDTQRAVAAIARCCAIANPQQREAALARVRARPALDDRLDAVFLAALQRHPERAGDWFTRLFERVPAAALVAFLAGRAGPLDRLRVAAALPPLPFLRALPAAWR
ncbi:MAG: lycopene cyclase family protein [Silanimonas sp.]